MNILYLDFLNPKSHLRLDINQIETLSKIGKVTVISPIGRYRNLPLNVTLIENKFLSITKGKLSSRLYSLRSMFVSSYLSRKICYDSIIVSSFETIIFSIGRFLYRSNKRIFLIHHFNIDELTSKIKALFFRTYMNKFEHIVFEEFIKKKLVDEFGIDSNRIHILPHHMNVLKIFDKINLKYDCVGLSNSNDEKIISKIVEEEKDKSLFKDSRRKVILKSKNIEYDNGFLKVIKGFIENVQFEDYLRSSRSIYMPFPEDFKYRMSGTLIDALSNKKIVYGSNIILIEHFALKYPQICKIIYSEHDFFEFVIKNSFDLNDNQLIDFKNFNNDYSVEKIKTSFEQILNSKKTDLK
jgi:hypothetical protein